MCISNIGNRRPFPTNGFKSLGEVDSTDVSMVRSSLLLKDERSGGKNPHFVVQHDYHDHSNENDVGTQEDHPARGGVTTPFPIKLHEMLNMVASNGHEHIVSWQPHGRCILVHKPKEFVELLPYYFKLSKLASFQRQLNLYGFQRLTRGRDRGGYYHELFLRNRDFLAHSIQRVKVKGTGVRARSNPDQEPDFWTMPWVQQQEPQTNEIVTTNKSRISSSKLSESEEQQSHKELVNFSRSGLPASFFSQQLPLHLEPTALPDHHDFLFGRHFHEVGMMINSETSLPQQSMVVSSSASPVLNTQETGDDSDELLAHEVDAFFEDFDFPLDDFGDDIEDDRVFGDLLEQMIS